MDKEEWEKIRKQAKFEKPYEFLKDQDCSQCDKKTKDHSFEELNHCIKGRESLKHICHNCNKKISEHTDEEKILCLAVLRYYPGDVDWLCTQQYRIEMDSVNGSHI